MTTSASITAILQLSPQRFQQPVSLICCVLPHCASAGWGVHVDGASKFLGNLLTDVFSASQLFVLGLTAAGVANVTMGISSSRTLRYRPDRLGSLLRAAPAQWVPRWLGCAAVVATAPGLSVCAAWCM